MPRIADLDAGGWRLEDERMAGKMLDLLPIFRTADKPDEACWIAVTMRQHSWVGDMEQKMAGREQVLHAIDAASRGYGWVAEMLLSGHTCSSLEDRYRSNVVGKGHLCGHGR